MIYKQPKERTYFSIAGLDFKVNATIVKNEDNRQVDIIENVAMIKGIEGNKLEIYYFNQSEKRLDTWKVNLGKYSVYCDMVISK